MELSYIFSLRSTCSSPSGIFSLHFLPLYKPQLSRTADRARSSFVSVTQSVPLSHCWGSPVQHGLTHSSIPISTPCFLPSCLHILHCIYLPSIKGEINEPLCPSLPAMLAPDELVPAAQSFLFLTAPCCFYIKSSPSHAWKTCTRSAFSVFSKNGSVITIWL